MNVYNTNFITLLQTLGYWLIERSKLNQQMKIFCMYCLSDQLSSSKIISFKFSSSISQSDCCSIRSASSMGIKSLSVQCTSKLPLLITHPLLSGDIVWLNLNFEAKFGLPTLYENGLQSPSHDLSRDPRHVFSFLRAERNYASEAGQADRRYRAVNELFNYFHRN